MKPTITILRSCNLEALYERKTGSSLRALRRYYGLEDKEREDTENMQQRMSAGIPAGATCKDDGEAT